MKRFSVPVDLRSRKEMTDFLQTHFRYDTMNSWNYATSYACNLKIPRLGLSYEIESKLYELQLRFYLSVADVQHCAFSCIWGNNPEIDLAMPEIERDMAMEDMIFQRLDEWIWSLEHDKPPTMSGVESSLAMESLARI